MLKKKKVWRPSKNKRWLLSLSCKTDPETGATAEDLFSIHYTGHQSRGREGRSLNLR